VAGGGAAVTGIETYVPAEGELVYTFGGRYAVSEIQEGQLVRVFTEDCFNGAVTGRDTLPSRVCHFPYLNPVSGPFFVAGAEPGDVLAVHLADIRPARPWGVSSTFPHFGALTSTHTTPTLQPPLEERVWVYDIDPDEEVVTFRSWRGDYTAALPLAAMLGTIGVAPAGLEARSTLTADTHGGNMDTPELTAGTTLYLPVSVPGALLAVGDGHARQGHGEASGVAVETAMHTTFAVEVIKKTPLATPRIESDQMIMSVGLARPLEDAYRIAHHDLVLWVSELTGMDLLDAYQLVAQAGQCTVGNVCDPNYSVVAKLPKTFLHDIVPFGDVHEWLREVADRTDAAAP
jgi:amidase